MSDHRTKRLVLRPVESPRRRIAAAEHTHEPWRSENLDESVAWPPGELELL